MTRADLYIDVAQRASAVVIERYSTSFGLACKLLAEPIRTHVHNIYAFVRVADEIVDGVGAESGLDEAQTRHELDALEAQTREALASGFSTNLVVQAFVHTARTVHFGDELIAPFFASMRADIDQAEHTQESFDLYVYGSAEVVGLMCLQAFLIDTPVTSEQHKAMVEGARALGAAFQKINFLRDLADDFNTLGRSYFPNVTVENFTEENKDRLLSDIENDLRVSATVLPMLPKTSRRAVALAQSLFDELTKRVAATPAKELIHRRVSVPNSVKAKLAASAVLGRVPKL